MKYIIFEDFAGHPAFEAEPGLPGQFILVAEGIISAGMGVIELGGAVGREGDTPHLRAVGRPEAYR